MENFQTALDLLLQSRDDYEKGKNGNKSAQRRVRKVTLEVEKLLKVYRKETLKQHE